MSDPAAAKVWSDPDTPASCLVSLLLDRYADPKHPAENSPLHWSAQTVIDEIEHETGIRPAPRNIDRLMGAIYVMTRPDSFHTSEQAFHDVAQAMASIWFEPTVAHELDTEAALWALVEAYIVTDQEDKEPYGPAVTRYVNMIARNEGFRRLPPVFTAYGIPSDPYVWQQLDRNSYDADPDLGPAAAAGAADREQNLMDDLKDRVTDLADRVATLPLRKGDPRGVAALLRKSIGV